jgi:hypothetical protein
MWESDPQPHGNEQQQREAHETIDIEQPIQQDEEDDFGDDFGDDFDDFAEGGQNDDADFGDFDEPDDTPSQPPPPPQPHKPPPAPDILAGLVSSPRNATCVPFSNLSFLHQAYDRAAAYRLLILTRLRRHSGSNSSLHSSHFTQLHARGPQCQNNISTCTSIILIRSLSVPLATTCFSPTNATTKLDTLPHTSTLPRQLGSTSRSG